MRTEWSEFEVAIEHWKHAGQTSGLPDEGHHEGFAAFMRPSKRDFDFASHESTGPGRTNLQAQRLTIFLGRTRHVGEPPFGAGKLSPNCRERQRDIDEILYEDHTSAFVCFRSRGHLLTLGTVARRH